jgi:uncharacterized protein YjiS (DUF1127 family)
VSWKYEIKQEDIMAFKAQAVQAAGPQPSFLHSTAVALRSGWQAYWERRALKASVVLLQSLDDHQLHDIGISRSEIESVVYSPPTERRHTYHGGACC